MSSNQGSGGSEKRQFWRLAVETWRTSGVSVRRFCKDEGLSSAAFYFWRRQLMYCFRRKWTNPLKLVIDCGQL